jgi:hypothetical protein
VSALARLSPDKQRVVRAQVRALLERSESFAALPLEEKRKLARGLVDTVAFMADPAAGNAVAVGEALADGTTASDGAAKVANRLGQKPALVQKEFTAAATRQGGEIFEQAANAIDFPNFVAGLIDGVFNSIVTASIRQMEAYGKLLEQVVKSVGDFAKDNFTLNQGRDWLVDRFPASLRIDTGGGGPRLAATDAGEDAGLADVRQGLGVSGQIDLDDEAAETRLAQMAQLEMARLRQKQLATMVLMGINRIVVTDGEINAKVVIDVQANDRAQRKATAAMHDDQQSSHKSSGLGGWFSPSFDQSQDLHKTVVTASSSDESESKAELKAKLTGAVRVNFKSETVSLDRLASQAQIESVTDRAQAPAAPAGK